MHTQPQIETLYLHKYVLIVRSDHKMPIANLPQGTNRRYFGDACECDSNTCPVNTEQSSRFFNLICSGEVQFTSNKHLQPVTYILVPSPVFKQAWEWGYLAHNCFGNANRTRSIFAFCFVFERCKHQTGKIERLYMCLVQQKTLQASQGLAINKIPKHSTVYTFILPHLPDPPFWFFEGLAPRLFQLCCLEFICTTWLWNPFLVLTPYRTVLTLKLWQLDWWKNDTLVLSAPLGSF